MESLRKEKTKSIRQIADGLPDTSNKVFWENIVKTLNTDGIVVMPTDTIYGILGSAFNKGVVERIYEIKKRNQAKPCIILISDFSYLDKFNITISKAQKETLKSFGENAISFILDCPHKEFEYLHRGTKTLSFRIPSKISLQEILRQAGPVIAPSANIEGEIPAKNIAEAKKYFNDYISLYVDGGQIEGKASKVIRVYNDGTQKVIRS